MKRWIATFGALAALASTPASAANLTLSGTLSSSCTLTIGRNGTLALAAGGTSIASTESGGQSGQLSIVSVGSPGQISLSAVSLTASPAGWSASHTQTLTISSPGGASATDTASSYSYTPSGLLDMLTVHGRLNSTAGFASGTYTLSTTVTCS